MADDKYREKMLARPIDLINRKKYFTPDASGANKKKANSSPS